MTHEIKIDDAWKLTPLERRFVEKLAAADGKATRGELHAALYPAGETLEKIVDVLVCRTRKKFTAHSVGGITNIWGRSRAIAFDDKARETLGLPVIASGPAL